MDIVVVGSIALDTIETPWGKAEDALGGSATYASVAGSYFAPMKIVGIAGSDLGDEAHEMWRACGVDTQGLQIVAGGQTFRWGGRYHQDMNMRDTLFTHLNVFEHFHPELPESYRDAGIVFLANIHPALQMEVLEQVHSPKLVAIDTMNLWIDIALDGLKEVLTRCDLLFLNDEEAKQLSGKSQLLPAVEALHAMGPKWVVVKKGEHGAILFTETMRFATPAVLLHQVYDPTGAGDSFAGAFLGSLARDGAFGDEALRRAMVHGTVLASFVTEQFSVDRLVGIEKSEILGRCQELSEMTRWPREL